MITVRENIVVKMYATVQGSEQVYTKVEERKKISKEIWAREPLSIFVLHFQMLSAFRVHAYKYCEKNITAFLKARIKLNVV